MRPRWEWDRLPDLTAPTSQSRARTIRRTRVTVLFGRIRPVALQARDTVVLRLRFGRFVVNVRRGGRQRLGLGIDNRRTVRTETSGRHETGSDGKHIRGLDWRIDASRR